MTRPNETHEVSKLEMPTAKSEGEAGARRSCTCEAQKGEAEAWPPRRGSEPPGSIPEQVIRRGTADRIEPECPCSSEERTDCFAVAPKWLRFIPKPLIRVLVRILAIILIQWLKHAFTVGWLPLAQRIWNDLSHPGKR